MLFRPENESDLVRPLCVCLGYLTTCEGNFLEWGTEDAKTWCWKEGTTGALALLHPTSGDVGLTKYQAL